MPRLPQSIEEARAAWRWRGGSRPPFAVVPADGQESVWDYPRPPALVSDARRVVVRCDGALLAETRRGLRLLETAHPPTWYLPLADVDRAALRATGPLSFCEWKGEAVGFDVVVGTRTLRRQAWAYPRVIDDAYIALTDAVAFYATGLDITVDGAPVRPQAGGLYGGWITPELVGPFKGEPGTSGW